MKELKKLQTEQEKVQREIRQKILLNKQTDAERRARTRRLIEHGAILESVFPSLAGLPGEEVKSFLLSLFRLPGVPKLPESRPESPETEVL